MDQIIAFLRLLAGDPDLLAQLRTRSKDEVLAAAAAHGLPFTEAEFDTTVWDLEQRLAKARDEGFDAEFGLWQTMWGQYYLEYLVVDLLSSLDETGLTSAPKERV